MNLISTHALSLSLLAVFGVAPIAAIAQTKDKPQPDLTWTIKEILAPVPGAQACYRRLYDAKHLREHPRQRTAEIALSLNVVGNYKNGESASEYLESVQTQWSLYVRRRHNKKMLSAGGDCSDASGNAHCPVDCDGGAIFLAKPATGDGLIVRQDNVRFDGGCDGAGVHLRPSGEDKVFKLEAAPPEFCISLEKERLGR